MVIVVNKVAAVQDRSLLDLTFQVTVVRDPGHDTDGRVPWDPQQSQQHSF